MVRTKGIEKFWFFPVMVTLFWLLAGCGSAPVRPDTSTAPPRVLPKGEEIVTIAKSLLGTPYRYGGTTPRGFDCSGLVYYTHQQVGIAVPRSAGKQYAARRPLRLAQLRPGDLLFFRLSRRRISHVAIYTGSHRFIHAPSSGKRVSYSSLQNPYWKKHFVGAGRLY